MAADAAIEGVSKRKTAQQERSKAKVQLILQTTMAMLGDGPADRITTNAIAKKAKISVGSLYQFFPNKEAIFYELFRLWLKQTLERLDDVGSRFDGSGSIGELADAVFESLTQNEKINSRAHWQLFRAMGSTEELVALEASHQAEVFKRIVAFREKFGSNVPADEARTMAMLQHHVTVGCLAAAAQIADDPTRQKLLEWGSKTMRAVYSIDSIEC